MLPLMIGQICVKLISRNHFQDIMGTKYYVNEIISVTDQIFLYL